MNWAKTGMYYAGKSTTASTGTIFVIKDRQCKP